MYIYDYPDNPKPKKRMNKQFVHRCATCGRSFPDEYGVCLCHKFDENNLFEYIECRDYVRVPKWLNSLVVERLKKRNA